jgi:hypothetical protein
VVDGHTRNLFVLTPSIAHTSGGVIAAQLSKLYSLLFECSMALAEKNATFNGVKNLNSQKTHHMTTLLVESVSARKARY